MEPDELRDTQNPVDWKRIGRFERVSEAVEKILAVRVRFELTEPVKVQRFSRPPDSTTLAPLRMLLSLALVAKKRL